MSDKKDPWRLHFENSALYPARDETAPPDLGAAVTPPAGAEAPGGERAALQALIEQYYGEKRWGELVPVLERFAALEADPRTRTKFSYSIAVILRDELKEEARALEFFNQALDDDSSFFRAFESIERLLTARQDWKTLERNYRKMLRRLTPEAERGVQEKLWRALGEIYRDRLGSTAAAEQAFAVAKQLEEAKERDR